MTNGNHHKQISLPLKSKQINSITDKCTYKTAELYHSRSVSCQYYAQLYA
jgi:hypothetical protein